MSVAVAPALPPGLRAALDALTERQRANADRAAAISASYRRGEGSAVEIRSERDALAYAVVRMPATFAAGAAVFARVDEICPDIRPKTLLDVGTGPGTLMFAAREQWPSLAGVEGVDSNGAFCDLARRLMTTVDDPVLAGAVLHRQALQDLAPEDETARFDLVTAGYVLAELPLDEAARAARRLFARSQGLLVLIEPGTPAGFARIRAARAALVEAGGYVVAPCPHDGPCPMAGEDWCHFSQRLPRSRAHMQAKRVEVPFEDERFSYVAVTREPLASPVAARIVAPVRSGKAGLSLRLCSTMGLRSVNLRPSELRNVPGWRRLQWGDPFAPLMGDKGYTP